MNQQPPQVSCPKCGSHDIHAEKKGFSGKKAVIGGVLTGGIGLFAGTIGSNNLKLTCLACGNTFKPGEKAKSSTVLFSPAFMAELEAKKAETAAKAALKKEQKVPSLLGNQILKIVAIFLAVMFTIATISLLTVTEKTWGAIVSMFIFALLFSLMTVINHKKIRKIRAKLKSI